MDKNNKKANSQQIRLLIDRKIDEFVKRFGREPGACEVREMEFEIERKTIKEK